MEHSVYPLDDEWNIKIRPLGRARSPVRQRQTGGSGRVRLALLGEAPLSLRGLDGTHGSPVIQATPSYPPYDRPDEEQVAPDCIYRLRYETRDLRSSDPKGGPKKNSPYGADGRPLTRAKEAAIISSRYSRLITKS